MGWQPALLLGALSLLEVDSVSSLSYCQAFHLRSLPLIPESLSPPRSLVHSGESPLTPSTSYLLRLPVFTVFPGPRGFNPFPSPNTRQGSSPHSTPQLLSTFPHRFFHPSPHLLISIKAEIVQHSLPSIRSRPSTASLFPLKSTGPEDSLPVEHNIA